MSTKTVLKNKVIAELFHKHQCDQAFARAIEQAVLHSEQVQAWRRDAELFQFLLEEAWFQRAFDHFDPDDSGIQSKFESECRRILIAAMENKT